VTYSGVALILIVTSLTASLLPAYRASRIAPLQALRNR
jgi:ABC-type lipoprotein release transport system permease subunit